MNHTPPPLQRGIAMVNDDEERKKWFENFYVHEAISTAYNCVKAIKDGKSEDFCKDIILQHSVKKSVLL